MAPEFITVVLQRSRTSSLPYRMDNSGIRASCRVVYRILRSTGTVNTPTTLTTPATSATLTHIRACLILRDFALSPGARPASLRKKMYGVVWNLRQAQVPHHTIHQVSAAGASKRA